MMKLNTSSFSAGNEYPATEMPSGNTLMELLDGVMLLYHFVAHKQLGKVSKGNNIHPGHYIE